MPSRQAKRPGQGVCTVQYPGAFKVFSGKFFFPSRVWSLPSLQPRAPVLGADFKARFTATVPGNQACSAQTKSEEIAWAIRASSCRATVSSKQGCREWQWSVTREQCDRSHFMRLPSKKKREKKKPQTKQKKPPQLLYCWAAGTELPERMGWHQLTSHLQTGSLHLLKKYSEHSSSAQRRWGCKYRSSSCPFCRASLTLCRAAHINRGFVRLSFPLPFRCIL